MKEERREMLDAWLYVFDEGYEHQVASCNLLLVKDALHGVRPFHHVFNLPPPCRFA